MLRKVGDGYVVLRQHSTEHYCRPPDTGSGPEIGGVIEIEPGTPRDRWVPGDMWLCSCGKAWKIRDRPYLRGWFEWIRSSLDDLA